MLYGEIEMTNEKKEIAKELTNTLYVADLILRVKSLENILISKGILTKEELEKEATVSSKEIIREILKKANVPGDLDQILQDLENIANFKTGMS
jgi:hypothetical protein